MQKRSLFYKDDALTTYSIDDEDDIGSHSFKNHNREN